VPAAVRSLDRFPLIRTRSADELCDALARVYAKPRLNVESRAKTGDVTFNYCQMKDIGLGYSKYGIGVRLTYRESNFTLQTFPVQGRGEAIVDDVVSPLCPRRGLTMSSGRSFAVKVNDGYEHFVLVIDPRALADKLSALTGTAVEDPLTFHPVQDHLQPAAKALRDHFFFLVDRLSASTVSLPEFVLDEFEQTLIVMFLQANRHNYSHLLEAEVPYASLSQVRLAEEYIEANAQRAVTLEELADLTKVSALSLFGAFKRYCGYSLPAFLAQTRSKRKAPPQ
jgi:AraC-binding-like domain